MSDPLFKRTSPPSTILPGISLGDFEDALWFNGPKVSVHENPDTIPPGAHWVPIMRGLDGTDSFKASRAMLDAATSIIRHYQRIDVPVLVHCAAGMERSPLVMAWFLRRYHYAKTLDEAYRMLVLKRPIVQDRRVWLEAKDAH